jgi:uncharacterized membrane protein YhaH (DUF805 family)
MLHVFFGFDGRINRGQWWLAQLIAIPAVWFFGGAVAIGLGFSALGSDNPHVSNGPAILLGVIGAFVVGVWINIASTVKRYHDRSKSGFWLFLGFVPFIGALWMLIECGFCSGDDGDNDYGPPSGSGHAAENFDREISGIKGAAGSGLAKLDDEYFKNYAAQASAQPASSMQTAYRSSGPVAASGSSKPVFGRR